MEGQSPHRRVSQSIYVIFLKIILFYLILAAMGLCCRSLSLVAASGSQSLVVVYQPLIAVASLVTEHQHCVHKLPQFGRMGSVVMLHGLSCPAAYGSSQTRGQTCVPCLGRRILYHWTTREMLCDLLMCKTSPKTKKASTVVLISFVEGKQCGNMKKKRLPPHFQPPHPKSTI